LNKLLVALLSAACACTTVFAAEDAAQDSKVETLVVTAARSPVAAAEIASSVTVLDRQYIEDRQAVLVIDLLRDVPGLQVSRSGGFGKQTQLRIRGSEANQVLVMIDGIEALDPAAADEFQWENLTTADVERIEVVRGPQSALWGNEALAGVVNIITRRDGQGLSASGFAEGGSFNTVNTGARVGGGGETWTGGVGVAYLDSDGTNVSRTGSEDDGYENTTLSGNASWNPTDTLSFGWVGRYTDAETYTDAVDFSTGFPTDPTPASGDARHEESNQLYTGLSGDLKTFDGRWRHNLRANVTSTDRDFYVDSGDKSTNSQGDIYALYYVSSIGLTGQASAGNPVLNLAVDWKRDEYRNRCFDADGVDCTAFGDPNQDQDMTNTGFVAELLSGDWNDFSGSASVRYDDNNEFDSETTYRLTGGYMLASATRLRGAYGTGWKAPTFTERFGFFPDQFLGNPDLEPETSKGWEVGVDQALLEDSLNLSVTYFDEKLEDEINGFFFDSDAGVFTAVNADGTSTRKGVEFITEAALGAGFGLQFNYTYLNARDPNGDREVRRPRQSAGLNGNYRFLRQAANINLNISYVGKRDDIFFPPFPNPSEIVELSDYTLVNLSSSYKLNKTYEIYGRLENLFDENYEDVYGFATQGIGGYLGLRVNFAR
jgi:vitamin B12 transporter